MSDAKLDDHNEPHDLFARQVADHPIESAAHELLLARALAEVLASNGRHPSDDDRYRYDHYTDQTDEALLKLAEEPLAHDDVEDLETGQRRTLYLIAQSVAHSDGGAEPSQVSALARLQGVLGLSAADAMLLEDAGQRHAAESAEMTPADEGDGKAAMDRRHSAFREQRLSGMRDRHAPEQASAQIGVFGSTRQSRLDR